MKNFSDMTRSNRKKRKLQLESESFPSRRTSVVSWRLCWTKVVSYHVPAGMSSDERQCFCLWLKAVLNCVSPSTVKMSTCSDIVSPRQLSKFIWRQVLKKKLSHFLKQPAKWGCCRMQTLHFFTLKMWLLSNPSYVSGYDFVTIYTLNFSRRAAQVMCNRNLQSRIEP